MDNEKFYLESLIFDVISDIYINKQLLNKYRYKLALVTLELLNAEYEEKFHEKRIDEKQILKYYEDLWCF